MSTHMFSTTSSSMHTRSRSAAVQSGERCLLIPHTGQTSHGYQPAKSSTIVRAYSSEKFQRHPASKSLKGLSPSWYTSCLASDSTILPAASATFASVGNDTLSASTRPSSTSAGNQAQGFQEAGTQSQEQNSQKFISLASGLVLDSGAFVLPHPDKVSKGGEDWYFISKSQRAIGVADGVGGWAEVGVDAGAYARMLMTNAGRLADEQAIGTLASRSTASISGTDLTDTAEMSAQTILEGAYNVTDVRGSSTACVLVLNGSRLFASNLGDSGFLIVRSGEVVMHTEQQQHSFNFPYQIGSSDAMGDSPTSAERYEVEVQEGDVLVMGTDGLWDNCFDEEVLSVIKYCQDGGMSASKTAQVLAFYARHRASDTKFASPFAYAAFKANLAYMGGKMDDITVVVSQVKKASSAAATSKL